MSYYRPDAPMKPDRPYLMLTAIILLWGTNYIVSRTLSGIAPVRVSGLYYALFRYLFGTLTMILVLGAQRKGLSAVSSEIHRYSRPLVLSALLSAFFVITTHVSAEFISSGTTSIIINLSPIIVLLFGIVILGEHLTQRKAAGFVLGLVGGLIFLWNSIGLSAGVTYGILLALGGMLSWAGYTITLHYLKGADPYIVMTVKHVASTFMILPIIWLVLADGSSLILIWDIWTVMGLLFAGVLASGLAYLLYFSAIESLGAPRASSFLFLVPFVSVAGDFVLGEPPAFVTLAAGLIAVIGVGLVKMSEANEQK
ncbi:DMT family transporter [Candidatus Thorarchaeota archaeon]|jgi:drug/metabolite transporter (DMT)-like permease|nr:MAG: DMT family transporter [Candidatus Thorarchaeota archaeon]